jgi:hypothetical protein
MAAMRTTPMEDTLPIDQRTIESMMADLVDRIAADPSVNIDERAWRQLLIYAPRFECPYLP